MLAKLLPVTIARNPLVPCEHCMCYLKQLHVQVGYIQALFFTRSPTYKIIVTNLLQSNMHQQNASLYYTDGLQGASSMQLCQQN